MLTSLLPPPLSLSPLAYLSSPFYFRATIQQYGEPQCQTVKKCIGMTPNTFKCIPVHAPPQAIIPTIASVPVAAPPSQENIEKVYEFLFSLIYSFSFYSVLRNGAVKMPNQKITVAVMA